MSNKIIVEKTLPLASHELDKWNGKLTWDSYTERLAINVSEYGICTHDYGMSPCTKGGECMACKKHIFIKGM
jgi:hypothetical protein